MSEASEVVAGCIYIFAGGGTGGHLYPALAVAEELRRLRPEARFVFACSNRPIDRRVLDPLPYAVVVQEVRPMPSRLRGWGPFVAAWMRSSIQANAMIRDLRPAAVLGMGGFAAAPVVRAAARKGVPVALLNPDAVPGRANRLLARHAKVIFAQYEATAEAFGPRSRQKVRCVGCPVAGHLLLASRDKAIQHFDLRDDRKTLLVLGGSLGAATVNEAIAALSGDLDELAETWQVLHITGPTKADLARAVQAGRIYVCDVEYCDRMDLAYAAADLAVCRAGAATTAELVATGTPAVLLPYPYHRDQQQRLNAVPLADAGAAVIVADRIDPAVNAEALREVLLPLMRAPAALQDMRRCARALAKPDSAGQIAGWLATAVSF